MTIAALTAAGYRVIALDQIGFCKSSKPAHYQFSFQQLAGNTPRAAGLARHQRARSFIGHSIGGMLGMRYALTFPDDVEQLVLVNPIGLEDWKAKGVPWQSVDAWYQQELKTTADSIRDYQRSTYYAGTWDAKYERWVQMLAGLYRGPGHDIVSWNAALVDDMAYTQPVFYEFEKMSVPVLLLIGDKDTTAIGKNLAPPPCARPWAIIRSWQKRRPSACRTRSSSNFPISATRRKSRRPMRFTRRCWMGYRNNLKTAQKHLRHCEERQRRSLSEY